MKPSIWKKAFRCISGCLMLYVPYAFSADCQTESRFTQAEIYYYGWDVLTRSRLSLTMVRENPEIQISIRDRFEVDCFVNWLQLDKLKENPTNAPTDAEDPRLVIDLFRSDNTRLTYYASRFNLASEDSRKKRPIDESFRNKFIFRGR